MKPGTIGWIDLTVTDAEEARDFYRAVVGWEAEGLDMGGYEDFSMRPPSGSEPVAGVCHARGSNKELPPVWLIYIVVEDLDESLARCREMGGTVIAERGKPGDARYAFIRDPAGATCALYQPA